MNQTRGKGLKNKEISTNDLTESTTSDSIGLAINENFEFYEFPNRILLQPNTYYWCALLFDNLAWNASWVKKHWELWILFVVHAGSHTSTSSYEGGANILVESMETLCRIVTGLFSHMKHCILHLLWSSTHTFLIN